MARNTHAFFVFGGVTKTRSFGVIVIVISFTATVAAVETSAREVDGVFKVGGGAKAYFFVVFEAGQSGHDGRFLVRSE